MMAPASSRVIPLWLILPMTICLSALVGWLDYHADEVQGAVLLLIVISGALSFAAPNRAWIIAAIMGLSVMGTYLVAKALGIPPTFPMSPPASGLLALIPAAIGAALGVGLRLAVRTAQTH